jgi:hypothetical protein
MAQAPPREGALRRLARRVRAAVAGAEEELLEKLDPGQEMAGDVVQETEARVEAEAAPAPEARIAAAEREGGYRSDEDVQGPALEGVRRAQPRAQEHK